MKKKIIAAALAVSMLLTPIVLAADTSKIINVESNIINVIVNGKKSMQKILYIMVQLIFRFVQHQRH